MGRVVKIGCLGIIGLFVLVFIIGIAAGRSDRSQSERPSSSCLVPISTTADDTLSILGKPVETRVAGRDENGLVVEWIYHTAVLTMKVRTVGQSSAYRVTECR